MSMFVSIEDVDLSQLRLAKTGRTVKLIYGENKVPLQLKTCKLYSPFGVKVYNNAYSQFTDCSIDCSIQQQGNSEKTHELYKALQDKIEELIKNSLNLFNTKEAVTDVNVSPIFRENGNYPKLMKINFPRDKNGNFDFVLFDENKEKIKLNDNNIESILTKGKTFVGIIECGKIWYYNNKFGITWNLIQSRFSKKKDAQEPDETGQVTSQDSKHLYMQNLMIDDD